MKKKYSEMTKAEKRVAVAKDVIEQIEARKIKAQTGSYVNIRLPKALNKRCVSSSVCPYDDWACRVYGWCGTQKCEKRAEKLRQTVKDK